MSERQKQLYEAFLKTIKNVGVDKLKSTSMFIRNAENTYETRIE